MVGNIADFFGFDKIDKFFQDMADKFDPVSLVKDFVFGIIDGIKNLVHKFRTALGNWSISIPKKLRVITDKLGIPSEIKPFSFLAPEKEEPAKPTQSTVAKKDVAPKAAPPKVQVKPAVPQQASNLKKTTEANKVAKDKVDAARAVHPPVVVQPYNNVNNNSMTAIATRPQVRPTNQTSAFNNIRNMSPRHGMQLGY